VRRLFAAIGRWLVAKTREPDVLQVHLINDEEQTSQYAQKTFEPPYDGPGHKLAWLSEMTGKSSIKPTRTQIYRPGEVGFMKTIKGDFGPSFIAPAPQGRR